MWTKNPELQDSNPRTFEIKALALANTPQRSPNIHIFVYKGILINIFGAHMFVATILE